MSSNSPFRILKKDFKTLKCALCNCYLSVGPVKISMDGNMFQCGRCDFENPEIPVRNIIYENLAKLMAFPCIYRNCQKKVPWSEVQQHELTCIYRTIPCPITNCNANVSDRRIINHFKEFHTKSAVSHNTRLIYRLYSLNRISHVVLFVQDDTPFFCSISNKDKNNFQINMYSVRSEPKPKHQRYRCTFQSPKGKIFSIPGEKIVPYDRKHCIKCYFGTCKLKFHDCVFDMETKVSIDLLRSILNSEICGLMFSIGSETNMKRTENSDIIKKTIECPICQNYMIRPIYSCTTGHSVCQECRKKLTECPTCRAEYNESRNYALEELSEHIKIPCQNKGCNYLGTPQDLSSHEDIKCLYKKGDGPPTKKIRTSPQSTE